MQGEITDHADNSHILSFLLCKLTGDNIYTQDFGCKFYVKNGNGGLLGGFTTLEAAKVPLNNYLNI